MNQNRVTRINRVCFVNPQGYMTYPPSLGKTDTGGQIVYVLELAKALVRKGIKVDILTRQFAGIPEEEQVGENLKILRIPCGSQDFIPKEKLYELMPELAENFMHYLEKNRKKYDLIHSHYWDGGYAGIILAKLLDLPHIYTPHSLGKLKKLEMGSDVEQLPPQKLKPAYRYHLRIAIEQKILNSVRAVLVLCETTRIQLLQHYMVDFEKLHVIPPGVDIDFFNPRKTQADKKIKLEKNAILTVSRMVPAKGLDRLIDALALLKTKLNFHLYIGGGLLGENFSEEERVTQGLILGLIKKYRLQKRVTFLGYVPHEEILPVYYRKAKAFVLPSRYEPLGMATLEAMACGASSVVSSVAGSREVIVNGLNGYIVDTHDRKALADSIFQLLTNEKLRKKISDNAALTINEHYSWEKITPKIVTLYSSFL